MKSSIKLLVACVVLLGCHREKNQNDIPDEFFTVEAVIEHLTPSKENIKYDSRYQNGLYNEERSYLQSDSLITIVFLRTRRDSVWNRVICSLYLRPINGKYKAFIFENQIFVDNFPEKGKVYTNVDQKSIETYFGKLSSSEVLHLGYKTVHLDLGIDVRLNAFYDSIKFE